MPLYTYRCPECRSTVTSTSRGNTLDVICACCGAQSTHRRVFGFNMKPMMHEHFNRTVGKPISDMRQFERELKKQSDLATETTGVEHRYVPVEAGDHAAVGATSEGIDESNRIRSMRGEPLLPVID